ncbi:hypothetical protein CSKR_108091 [Clonorchis sinensis]|uniref:Axin-1 n=2 Tax=Clonorchis sinensis TaxID=79923 RepID=A0A8T1M6T3_CLOSI|nr:hypothetical protein CSKR_108091 [Clonorchis sinensis]
MALQALADPRHFYGIPEQETKFFCNNGIIDSGFSRSSRRAPEAMEALLCDSDGVERFNQFLRSNYSSGHLLDFWFACKGFRSNVDPNDSDKLFQVAKVIYRTYIKSGATCAVPLPSPLKHDIIGRMSSYHRGYKSSKGPIPASTAIDRSLFDLAQKSVMSLLEQTYYPKFVEFVNGPPSPSRPCNDAVPNSTSGSMLLSSAHPSHDCQTLSHSFTEKTPRSKMRWKRKGHKLVPEQLVGKEDLDHSGSSLPRTRPSSSDDRDKRIGTLDKEQHQNARVRPLMEMVTRDDDKAQPSRPLLTDKDGHTRKVNAEHGAVKQGQNLAETDPSAFVLLLTARLEKVKESRGKMEKLLSWVNQADDKYCTSTGVDIRDPEYRAINSLVTEEAKTNSTVPLLPAPPSSHFQRTLDTSSFHTRTQSIAKRLLPDEGKFVDPLADAVADEDAQGILDDHCSRIWADDFDPIPGEDISDGNPPCSRMSRMVQSSYVPGKSTDPISRRSVLTSCTSAGVGGRRRTSLSAVASQCARLEGESSNDPYRYRSSYKRSDDRSKRSDARSTASWDSGVVDHCPLPDLSHCRRRQLESETKSLVAAASLQALSSSTTELAIVNSEVTAQLVERMTRQYQLHHRHTPATHPNGPPTDTSRAVLPCYQNFDPFCHPSTCQPCGPTSARFPPVPSAGTGFCSGSFDGFCHCDRHRVRPRLPSPGRVPHLEQFPALHGHSAFPTASDTSSTFDSGISSTYDKLPLVPGQANTDRTSRSSTTFDCPNHRTHHLADSQHRAPFCNPSIQVPPHVAPVPVPSGRTDLSASFYSSQSHSNMERKSLGDCACPTCVAFGQAKGANQLHSKVTPTPYLPATTRPTGQLLQCWLQLQTSSSAKHVHPMGGDASSEGRTQKPCVRHDHQHSRHANRHSSSGPKSVSVCDERLAPQQTMVQWPADKSQTTEQQHKVSADCSSDSKDTSSSAVQPNGIGLIVGYYLCDDPVPYRTVWMGRWHGNLPPGVADAGTTHSLDDEAASNILTLGQFKQLIAKKGVYRYFFKKPSDEFGTGAVHEELTDDNAVLPLWDGKVVARIERAD